MPIARKRLIDPANPGWVHCTSRCVRRAFLCGDGKEHRRQWIEDRLRLLAQVFACEVASYAVMSNHVHVVVRMAPEVVHTWTDPEVARRWFTAFGGSYRPDGSHIPVDDAVVLQSAQDAAWVAERRQRLGDLGWLMRALKEHIARRANREDGCTGAFWEGRFSSTPLLDQTALLACMAYVDLNPVRAGKATTPEDSAHTSAHERTRTDQPPQNWLHPVESCQVAGQPYDTVVSLTSYLELIDATGRTLRAGKRGAIDPQLPPILSRLGLKPDAWMSTMTGWRTLAGGRALGSPASRAAAAITLGLRWIKNRCPLFAEEAA